MAKLPDEIFFESAVELNQRLVRKDLTSVELTKAFAERLEAVGPKFNALASSLRGPAVDFAKDVDKELKRGRTRGPLQGVPYAVKDLLAVAGRPTTWGAKPFATQVFKEDAEAVKRLRKTGAVLTGKLSMVELAGGGGYRYAAASLQGPGLNPWNPERWSGGSSSGSAAAVAAGLVPYAIGSETNGSIVTPAAYCGVTGLRPTYGLVSRRGAMALAWTMDKLGPLARTAEDCGHVLAAMSGGDDQDPGSAGRRFHFAPQFARPVRELHLGFASVDFEEFADPSIRAPLREALNALRSMTGGSVEAELPDFPYGAVSSTVIASEAVTVFADLIQSGKIDELADRRQIEGLKAAQQIKASDYLQAMRIRRLVQAELAALLAKVDVLVTPARFTIASKVAEPLTGGVRPSTGTAPRGLRALTTAGNLAGVPALVLPCGFADGMPVGIMLVSKAFGENTLLKLGIQYQSQTSHHRQRPKL